MKMMTYSSLAMIVAAVMAVMVHVEGADPCEPYANGCSLPFHMPFFYKTVFTPSCNKHDVCYRCGAKYGISRATCDSTFLQNMQAACATQDSSKRRALPPSLSSSSTLKMRSACTAVATGFYESVHLFGGLFYRDVANTESFCDETAARSCLPH